MYNTLKPVHCTGMRTSMRTCMHRGCGFGCCAAEGGGCLWQHITSHRALQVVVHRSTMNNVLPMILLMCSMRSTSTGANAVWELQHLGRGYPDSV
jgi:hypothetical protein